MKVIWLNDTETRAQVIRRRWPKFWLKETTIVVFKVWGGYEYWFYEDRQNEGQDGMVEGHHNSWSDNPSSPEHHAWRTEVFSMARTLFNKRDAFRAAHNRRCEDERLQELADARAKKNPWKKIEALPKARLLESPKETA